MRTLKFSLLLAVLVPVNSLSEKQEYFAAFVAIKAILIDYFVVNEPKLDFIFCGPNSEALADRLLREKQPGIIFQVTKKCNGFQTEIFMAKTSSNELMFVPQAHRGSFSVQDMIVENRNFIQVKNMKTVDLFTSFWYSPGHSQQTHVQSIQSVLARHYAMADSVIFP